MRRAARADRRPAAGRRARRLAAGPALLVAAAALLAAGCGGGAEPRAERRIVVAIPRGTAARIARGERVDAVPRRIVAHVGDRLRLVNRDAAPHTIGPFLVGPHESLEARLARAGTFEGACTAHPDGKVVIDVHA